MKRTHRLPVLLALLLFAVGTICQAEENPDPCTNVWSLGMVAAMRSTDNHLTVVYIVPNSPAAKAGVQDGTQIVVINGLDLRKEFGTFTFLSDDVRAERIKEVGKLFAKASANVLTPEEKERLAKKDAYIFGDLDNWQKFVDGAWEAAVRSVTDARLVIIAPGDRKERVVEIRAVPIPLWQIPHPVQIKWNNETGTVSVQFEQLDKESCGTGV